MATRTRDGDKCGENGQFPVVPLTTFSLAPSFQRGGGPRQRWRLQSTLNFVAGARRRLTQVLFVSKSLILN